MNRLNTVAVARLTGLNMKTINSYHQRYDIGERIGKHVYYTLEELSFIRSRMEKVGRPKKEALI